MCTCYADFPPYYNRYGLWKSKLYFHQNRIAWLENSMDFRNLGTRIPLRVREANFGNVNGVFNVQVSPSAMSK